MRIFKNKLFARWADKEDITDKILVAAVCEIASGLVDANLGGNVIKKRVAVTGRGKSAGKRAILAYQLGDKAFLFMVLLKMPKLILKMMNLRL